MATQSKKKTTKHTCGGPVFGQKTPGCPRCDELLAGAAPVVWNRSKADFDKRAAAANRGHVCTNCGPVCTFGDW